MSLSDWPGDTRFLRALEALFLHLSTTPEWASGPCSLGILRHFFATRKLVREAAGIGVNRAFAAHVEVLVSTAFSTRWTT
jgi:hypothetical protein